ncbi:hypothetical protein LY76DRAFT_233902 [Colletotrichum caudatum]|nr:hypothetical protein LY76DRAFT_233902 [Colletotrichum caudatum]
MKGGVRVQARSNDGSRKAMGASDLDPYNISSRGPPPPPHRTVRPSRSSTAAAAGAILVCLLWQVALYTGSSRSQRLRQLESGGGTMLVLHDGQSVEAELPRVRWLRKVVGIGRTWMPRSNQTSMLSSTRISLNSCCAAGNRVQGDGLFSGELGIGTGIVVTWEGERSGRGRFGSVPTEGSRLRVGWDVIEMALKGGRSEEGECLLSTPSGVSC